MATKETKQQIVQAEAQAPQPSDNSLSIISVVLGTVSLIGPGLLLGIPAIIVGAIALKKQQGEKGVSITGIVTGAISTVFSVIILALVIWGFVWGMNHPEEMRDKRRIPTQEQRERFDLQRS
ncbi:MAG TPA: DUF4190 domain-containing protein [Candidatus Saccharimonadales bacterium]|nr:DUF4190 domain-containing protein [Candidatus Saccharimonadales bacterium]